MSSNKFDRTSITLKDDDLLSILLASARRAVAYTSGVSAEAIRPNEQRADALCFSFASMGEMAAAISEYISNLMGPVPWQELIHLRNRLLREHVSKSSIAAMVEIAQRDLPPTIEVLEAWLRDSTD